MRNPFRKIKEQPENEQEEKWEFIGSLSGLFIAITIFLPLLAISGNIRNVPEFSIEWFVTVILMAAWPIQYIITLKWWMQLAHNFGVLMYRMDQAEERKRKQ